jgi:hypothetical protein
MAGELYRWLIEILGPPVRMVAYLVGKIYSLLFGWYDKKLARRAISQLEQEIHQQLSFLFSSHSAQMMPIEEIRSLKDIDWPTITVSVGGLLLRFLRWRGELQVYVTSQKRPNDWVELSLLLSLIEVPRGVKRRPDYRMSEVAEWLRASLDTIIAIYSDDRYSELKERLTEVDSYDRLVARQWQTEINRRLYPDK